MGFVDVRDVATAHWLAYEKSAGRHLCITSSHHYEDWYNILREIVPDANIPTEVASGERPKPMLFDNSKLRELGWNPIDLRTSLVDTVQSLKQK
jgi:nucleoside-diphosphate-sugar epimerase